MATAFGRRGVLTGAAAAAVLDDAARAARGAAARAGERPFDRADVEVDGVSVDRGDGRGLRVAMQSVYRSIEAVSDDMPLDCLGYLMRDRPARRKLLANLAGRHVARVGVVLNDQDRGA